MIISQNTQQACFFCSKLSQEKKHLFFILFKTLAKELQHLTSKYEHHSLENEHNGFKQILRIVFGQEATQFETICEHRKYYSYFMIKLKCNQQNFNFICHSLVQKLAEKNYHLQLLATQIKNSAQNVAQGRVKPHKDYDLMKRSNRNFKKSQRGKSQQKFSNSQQSIKVEACQIKQCLIPSGSITNSISYIPIYNSQFSIMEPCQQNVQYGGQNNIGFYYQPYSFYSPYHNN